VLVAMPVKPRVVTKKPNTNPIITFIIIIPYSTMINLPMPTYSSIACFNCFAEVLGSIKT
jgi:hypothetical protein